MDQKILVIGACGQIGTELTAALRLYFGKEQVLAADRVAASSVNADHGPYVNVDVLNKGSLQQIIRKEKITQIYHLAAVLSAVGENDPQLAWQVNIQGLLNVLDLAVEEEIGKVFWPSSIAVFGSFSPSENCPQHTVTEPGTVYGISKVAGENWCQYYHEKYGLDVRSIRYPGLISYLAAPGGGTTDYAVDIFHYAVKGQPYPCFLNEDTALPMMYMSDAIRATIELMEAPSSNVKIRTSYNLSSLSFTPLELAEAIKTEISAFQIYYVPDFRQKIAEGWPASIDDSEARKDWGWKPQYKLLDMVKDMLSGLTKQKIVNSVNQ